MSFTNNCSLPAETFILWGAVAFFVVFLFWALAARLASGRDSYARLNRAHTLFFILYLAAALLFAFRAGELNAALLPALAVGCAVYFSLHYVYLFALVGLVKKSISINLLTAIADLSSAHGRAVPMAAFLADQKDRIAFIRADRLGQMVTLQMAERNGDNYRITRRGRLLDRLGRLILKIWNLERI